MANQAVDVRFWVKCRHRYYSICDWRLLAQSGRSWFATEGLLSPFDATHLEHDEFRRGDRVFVRGDHGDE
jgi:hypothetical protein